MVNESIAIVAVLAAAVLTSIKAKKGNYFVLMLPVFSVPIFYFIAKGVEYFITSNSESIMIGFIVAGGIVGSLLSFIVSHFLKTDKARISYTVLGAIFSLGLMGAYIINLV